MFELATSAKFKSYSCDAIITLLVAYKVQPIALAAANTIQVLGPEDIANDHHCFLDDVADL